MTSLGSSRQEEVDGKGSIVIVAKKKGRKSFGGRKSFNGNARTTKNANAPKFNAEALNASIGNELKKQVQAKLQKDILSNWDF